MKTYKIVTMALFTIFFINTAQAECNFFVKWAMQAKWDKNKWLGEPLTDFTSLAKEKACFRHIKVVQFIVHRVVGLGKCMVPSEINGLHWDGKIVF